MSNKKTLLFLALILLIPLSLAQDLEIIPTSQPDSLCPGTTGVFTDVVRNNGNSPLQVTVVSSGSASDFTTTVPQGFTLLPGKTKTIYSYMSPKSTTPQGDYSLRISAEAGQETDVETHSLQIVDCYDYSLSTVDSEKLICPGQSTRFDFELRNNGNYINNYRLDVTGEYSSNVILSDSLITLEPGQLKIVNANVFVPENDQGSKDFTISSEPNIGSFKSTRATVKIDSCYDFNIETSQNLITTCDHEITTVPVTIRNIGTSENTYNLRAIGPAWANVENTRVVIPAGSSRDVNLILSPDYGVEGNFQVSVEANPEKGRETITSTFSATVNKCHDVSLQIQADSDNLCSALEKDYEVSIRNNGDFEEEFLISLSGPVWSSISDTSLTIEPNTEEKITLRVSPTIEVKAGSYNIEVTTILKDSTKVRSLDTLEINAIDQQECFKVSLNAEDRNTEVPYDSTATIPIIIKNNGLEESTYNIALSGTASEFIYLNPSSLELSPGDSEILYLYVAPSANTKDGAYSATISARTQDNSVLATETVNIAVEESRIDEFENENFFSSIFSSITGFFSAIFSSSDEPVEDLNETLNESEVIKETEIPEEQEEVEQPEEPVIEEETSETEEEVSEEETTEDLNETNLESEINQSITGAFSLDNLRNQLVDYRSEIIWVLVILIIILLIIRFELHKKLFKLFEEEIEEEKPKDHEEQKPLESSKKPEEKKETKEEPKEKKEDSKKESKKDKDKKKKEPPKETEDDDEVIIEFDED